MWSHFVMKMSKLALTSLYISAGAILSACSGLTPSQLAPSVPIGQSVAQSRLSQTFGSRLNMSDSASGVGVAALQTTLGPSWMLPEAKNEELLYVANLYSNIVRVYSYPAGELVGSLQGNQFFSPDGVCIDKKKQYLDSEQLSSIRRC
jgi:hypothetical protein